MRKHEQNISILELNDKIGLYQFSNVTNPDI